MWAPSTSSKNTTTTTKTSAWSSCAGVVGCGLAVLVAVVAAGIGGLHSRPEWVVALDDALTTLQGSAATVADHVYLNRGYAPVRDEHAAVPAEVVEGAIPADLAGVFLRNGPNPLPEHDWRKGYHWFDGHGHLHTLRVPPVDGDGAPPLYSNSYVPTPRYHTERAMGREHFLRVGEIRGFLGILKAVLLEPIRLAQAGLDGLTSGPANTHTILTSDAKLYATHEASLPLEIELKEDGSVAPNAVGHETLGGVLDYPVSAHPRVDPASGDFLFHSYSGQPDLVAKDGSFKVGEYNATTGTVESYYGIRTEDGHSSFGHDLVFTENWFVIYDSSSHFDAAGILEGEFFKWNPDHHLKIGLAPRPSQNPSATSDDVVWFDTGKPRVMIHPLNAWEEADGTVVVWTPVGDHFDVRIESGTNKYAMCEFRLNPSDGTSTMTVIDATRNVEFPRVRNDFLGKFARYGTASIMDTSLGGDALFTGFVVYDLLEKKVAREVIYPTGEIGGEAVIVPKPGRDDAAGFYVATILWKPNNQQHPSDWVLYDGETGALVARVRLPHRVPVGFHGEWIPEGAFRQHLEYHQQRRAAAAEA